MKLIFAGLILFGSINAAAQTSQAVYPETQKRLTAEKMREVILADERQHEAKAPITLNNNLHYEAYQPQTSNYQVVQINYVKQHHNALLQGPGFGLSLAKPFTRYSNTPNMSNDEMNKYYRAPNR